jgi:hypothetical protein
MTFIKNTEIKKLIKIFVILAVLYLAYRIFTTEPFKPIEGFESFLAANTIYGNEIMPTVSFKDNTATFTLPGVTRIDTIRIYLAGNVTISNAIPVNLQYLDPSGNLKYIMNDPNSNNMQITINNDGTNNYFVILPVIGDDGNLVYTNEITLTIGDPTFVKLNTYLLYYDFYGRNKGDLTFSEFQNQIYPNSKNVSPTSIDTNNNVTQFSLPSDHVIYSMKVSLDNTSFPTNTNLKPDLPYILNVHYTSGIYPGQTLQVNDSFTVRCDSKSLNSLQPHNACLFFSSPIIANSVYIKVNPVTVSEIITSSSTTTLNPLQLTFKNNPGLHSVYGSLPSSTDIQNFQRTAQMLKAGSFGAAVSNLDICPSMDSIIEKQIQAQQLCDSLEYQDKIKAEQIRLDKNKQYLTKLKSQQDQIDQLNQAISQLQNKRITRDKNNDVARVMRYKNQKEAATTVRDLANQRLQSQEANNLHLNVNII